MSQQGNNPADISKEELLHFLDTASLSSKPPRNEGLAMKSGCPPAGSYMRLVLGSAEGKEAEGLLEHASGCETCGAMLAASLRALEGNPSAEEVAAIAELAAAKTPWQEQLAERLASTKTRKPPVTRFLGPRSGKQWLATAAAVAGVAAAVGLIAWQRQESSPEHLLAMAYQQSRTIELRIPEAGYTGLTADSHTRGTAVDSEAAPLLEARAGLARHLERSPQDAHWLELQARADVLAEHYDSAIDVLDRLLAAGPVTAELLTDAAAAYYQRGLVSGRELDRSTALDYLRRADELAPADPVVLFNEAIVMEDRGQMMNAVEVWNRYITVERDVKWAAEGKRKLAALEQTLNKLKSHESRIRQMLATPESMDALANNPQKLAALDEELSSVQLDKVLRIAYPAGLANSDTTGQARGSPCTALCMAARRLLQATARSLETQHHDFWLSDLLSVNLESPPNSLSADKQIQYQQALQLLGQATREDQTGKPAEGARLAMASRTLFEQLKEGSDGSLRKAADAGEQRATVEYLFALQRRLDFRGGRAFAQRMRKEPKFSRDSDRYRWIEAVSQLTEGVCDDTPETRTGGRKLETHALQLATESNYSLLRARVRAIQTVDAVNGGDDEAAQRMLLAVLRDLVATDPPIVRIVNTVSAVSFLEQSSPRLHMAELSLRETLAWYELEGDPAREADVRMKLAELEMRIGAVNKAEMQLQKAYAETESFGWGKSGGLNITEAETSLAQVLLERGDWAGATRLLDQVSVYLPHDSDMWEQRQYAAALGQLDLSRGKYDSAAQTLESDIRSSEGKDVRKGDRVTAIEYAAQDHDLYAELAATWLAQGRPPASVLALWERFRLRSRGLPIRACPGHALDCEESSVLAEQHKLGNNVLVGQIVLLDRVLVYRMDGNGVVWSQQPLRRRDVLDAAQILERAVSSPFTSTATAEQLGVHLSDSLLPTIPASLNADAVVLLEPDPMLQNLSWPILPTAAGPLGLHYAVAELPSILADEKNNRPALASSENALVVGASVAAEGEPPLPEAIHEAQAVNGFLHAPDLLLGEQATTARIAQRMGTATVFHFAGHAVQSKDGTELLLAPTSAGDSRPWVDGEFLRQHPPRACRLAVLSACATGEHDASWNHPLQDIVETLSSLGVPEVVATRWQISSEAAVPFMDSMYRNLKQGGSVAAALTAARKLQSKDSSYSNPYYWGAYYVTGRESIQGPTHKTGELHASVEDKIQGKKDHFKIN